MIQYRAMNLKVRSVGEGEEEKKVAGLGVVYDKWVEMWPGFKERILSGSVTLAPEVKSYFNHNPSNVLSTSESNPPLELKETDKGLEYTTPIPPTSYGKDLEVNLERGNVKGSSFAFDIPAQGDRMWEDENGVVHREISKLILYEVGPVTDPAYIQTNAQLRSAERVVEDWRASLPPVNRLLRQKRQKLVNAQM